MNHICRTIERSDAVFIKHIERRWYWCFAENPNTTEEKVDAHEIRYCPYCGLELTLEVGEDSQP